METILLTFVASFALQLSFFFFAALLKTDKVTDLSYALTFLALAWLVFFVEQQALLLALAVTLWAVRLGGYLFLRILHMKRDKRFDGIRENFWRFAKFWFLQALAVWLILLPVTIGLTVGKILYLGFLIWALGFVLETVADHQKYTFKKRHPGKLVTVGLWKHGRHPNYFGELLCWWGLFIAVLPSLSGWLYLSVLGPLFLTVLLLFVTGIPTIEQSHRKHYGKEYESYRKRTRLFI
ncbi:MAG: DUF1295 domain-containing protein [Candidatus Woesearchaeota archaeon]|nr:DUF1295 domain-containing protein [Candidatus Woesearchaeota archaeon]